MSEDKTPKDKDKIIKFPTLAERDRIRRKEREKEEQYRRHYRAQNTEPFFKFGNIPPFTKTLILSLLIVQIIYAFALNDAMRLQAIYTLGFIPQNLTQGHLIALLTPLTFTLLHSGWVHFIFNAVMGLALGLFFEKAFSTRAAALFFILCTVGSAAFYFALNPTTTTPVIGASGGISGLFASFIYISLTTGRTANPLSQTLGKYGPWPILIFWGAFMALPGMFSNTIAWQAHLGGYLTGIALTTAMHKGLLRL